MALETILKTKVDEILDQTWTIREGKVVPETDDVALAGGGVELDAVFLYADLADSTELAWKYQHRTAAKIMKAFLYCASRIITGNGGTITSFDGDRVMAVYLGDSKNSNAATTALKINYAVTKIIRPKAESRFTAIKEAGFVIRHATGIDSGKVLAVRAGMRGSNDLIWIGRAPGIAAKLSDIREVSYRSFITSDVYGKLSEDAKLGGNPKQPMWEKRPVGVKGLTVYRSSWRWTP